jgi:hypothetical protein
VQRSQKPRFEDEPEVRQPTTTGGPPADHEPGGSRDADGVTAALDD